MIFSYLVQLVILEFVWCGYVPDEIYPKKSVATPAHHHIQTKTQILNEFTSDATKTANENYFPGVIYPTSILDIVQPFFYRENTQDLVLGPFSDDVKSSYKYITSKAGKNKNINNHILKNILQSQENLECSTENKENTYSNENENKDQILSQLSNENIHNINEDTFMVNRDNKSISTSTSDSQTNSYTDVDEDISCSHPKDEVKNTSDEVDNYFEDIERPVKENVNEVSRIISDLKKKGSNEGKSVSLNFEFNLTKEINETSLERDIEPNQNIFLDNHNLTSDKVIMMDLKETLPPLPVGCFENRNVTSNILTKPADKDILLSLEKSSDTTLKIDPNNDNHTIGNLECSETDLYLEMLPVNLENETYSNYDNNCTNIDDENPEAQDENEEFFLDMIISLASICETDGIEKTLNKDNEKKIMEIPIIDQNNIPMYNMSAVQEHKDND